MYETLKNNECFYFVAKVLITSYLTMADKIIIFTIFENQNVYLHNPKNVTKKNRHTLVLIIFRETGIQFNFSLK